MNLFSLPGIQQLKPGVLKCFGTTDKWVNRTDHIPTSTLFTEGFTCDFNFFEEETGLVIWCSLFFIWLSFILGIHFSHLLKTSLPWKKGCFFNLHLTVKGNHHRTTWKLALLSIQFGLHQKKLPYSTAYLKVFCRL